MSVAIYLVSEWVWQPLWDRLTSFDERVRDAERVERERYL